jgi:dUTPase
MLSLDRLRFVAVCLVIDPSAHDRIAQLIVEQIMEPVVRLVAELDASVRSDGGFGSTGRK